MERMAKNIFGTLDKKHPGVETLTQGPVLCEEDVLVQNYGFYENSFAGTFVTAGQIRTTLLRGTGEGHNFQTRNQYINLRNCAK